MQKRSRIRNPKRTASKPAAKSTTTAKPGEMKSVMAEMGRKGGRIGGKRRAANMSQEARHRAASLAARARWSGKTSEAPSVEEKRDTALRKIAAILEAHLTYLGLSEKEKNTKTAELSRFVEAAVIAKIEPRARRPKPPQKLAASA
jgi:hypothetical protein